MKLDTRNFGQLEIDKEKIIKFNNGLPGFPDEKEFILLENEPPLYWLQSVTDGDIAFVIIDVYELMPTYNPLVETEYLEDLGDYEPEDLMIYNIAVLPDDIQNMSVNLAAPIIINRRTFNGKQIILNDEEYPVRYHLFEDTETVD